MEREKYDTLLMLKWKKEFFMQFFMKHFIKNENYQDSEVRSKIGILASILGVVINIVLFIGKFLVGSLVHSIAIVSDGFNNLADCANGFITLYGYKLAAKPADRDHPFGHGRVEYVTTLVVAIVIMFVGFELLKSSIEKIVQPHIVYVSSWVLGFLVLSILVKLWMCAFNYRYGKKCNNRIMIATSKDALNDVVATTSTLIGLILVRYFSLPFDGIMGVVASLFVMYSSFQIGSSIIDDLIGKPLDKIELKLLTEYINTFDKIYGVHDVIVHDYGPSIRLGSAHVEVDAKHSVLEIHEVIDRIEKGILEKFNIQMTLHTDPYDFDDVLVNSYYKKVKILIKEIDTSISMHDFRVAFEEKTCIRFELLMPYELKPREQEIKGIIEHHFDQQHCIHIIFDYN